MLLFGLLFAIFENPQRPGSIFSSRWFWHGFVFVSLFNVAVVYAALTQPDWMWMYFTEHSRNSVFELGYIFLFAYYVPYAFGFFLGLEARRLSGALWLVLLVASAAINILIVWHLFDRYSVIGTRLEFESGTAVSLFGPQNPIRTVMNLSLGLMVADFVWVLFCYKRFKKNRRGSATIAL